ncbi:hypothetical protein ACJMK2_009806 [Sinanodonta woodiana]|uniref:F-box domain-containing protein n=1 Tax=Sinanodonta woodiana TaxID=1069815 RepID=A0ABD3VDG1_SINWO
MSERNLRFFEKREFRGTKRGTGKRKPNQLYVCDISNQRFFFPRGKHFNNLPVQLILEIFKYLWVYELLRKVSLVCKYWYNLCRDRRLWTSVTLNGTPRTLGQFLELTKYNVHELVLTNSFCNVSNFGLACLLKRSTGLKCLKLPKNACRELFERVLPKTSILGGKLCKEKEIEIALTSVEHKSFYTLDEFLAKHSEDIQFLTKLKSLHRGRYSRSVRVYDKIMKTPDIPFIRKCPLQDCRTSKMLKQPIKTKPRPPKGRMNHHKKIKKFKGLQKRFKMFSLT